MPLNAVGTGSQYGTTRGPNAYAGRRRLVVQADSAETMVWSNPQDSEEVPQLRRETCWTRGPRTCRSEGMPQITVGDGDA